MVEKKENGGREDCRTIGKNGSIRVGNIGVWKEKEWNCVSLKNTVCLLSLSC